MMVVNFELDRLLAELDSFSLQLDRLPSSTENGSHAQPPLQSLLSTFADLLSTFVNLLSTLLVLLSTLIFHKKRGSSTLEQSSFLIMKSGFRLSFSFLHEGFDFCFHSFFVRCSRYDNANLI